MRAACTARLVATTALPLLFAASLSAQPQPAVVHVKGDPAAPVHLIEFADFACTTCGQFARETLPLLEREYIATGRLRVSFVPFNLGFFKPGRLAARAAECAAAQDAFWPMHDVLYARQREWLGRGAQRDRFHAFAAEIGLDEAVFRACYDAGDADTSIDENSVVATGRGVRATPTFFLGDRRLEGALDIEMLRNLLDAELARPRP